MRCGVKKRFATQRNADRVGARWGQRSYFCGACMGYHLTRSEARPAAPNRPAPTPPPALSDRGTIRLLREKRVLGLKVEGGRWTAILPDGVGTGRTKREAVTRALLDAGMPANYAGWTEADWGRFRGWLRGVGAAL